MAVQQTTTQTILPEWYTQYAQNLLGRAYSATSEPYQPYQAPRIAGFQPEQEQAFGAYKSSMGEYQPYLGAATAALGAGTGSFTAPGVAGQYMNPYVQNVISGIGSMAGRNLYENILPQLNRTFVGGGTFGGSRSQEFMRRAVRDTQESALSKQLEAMNTAYNTGMSQYNTEADRLLKGSGLFSSLANQVQDQRNKELAGLQQIGQQRQNLAQRSADLAYQDFEQQRDYPFTQVQRLAGIGGSPSASGTGTQIKSEPGTSGTANLIGNVAGVIGTLGSTGAFGSGGWLGLKDGGEVEGPVKNGKRNIKHPMHGLGWLKDVK